MKKILIGTKFFSKAVLMIILFMSLKGFSQTAIYYCPKTNLYGYSNGINSKLLAYDDIIKKGGKKPKLVCYSKTKGYGALVIGYTFKGKMIMSTADGDKDDVEVILKAWNKCVDRKGIYGVYVKILWKNK